MKTEQSLLKAYESGETIQCNHNGEWHDFVPQNQLDRPNLKHGTLRNWRIKPLMSENIKSKNSNDRNTGYYWVKMTGEWYLSKYYSITNDWQCIGGNSLFSDSDFEQIDETPITRPEPLPLHTASGEGKPYGFIVETLTENGWIDTNRKFYKSQGRVNDSIKDLKDVYALAEFRIVPMFTASQQNNGLLDKIATGLKYFMDNFSRKIPI